MSMMDEYNAFRVKLDAAIDLTLQAEVEKELTLGILASVGENVYGAYSPESYKRRFNDGGLFDEENYKSWTEKSGDIYTLNIKNETKGNAAYSRSKDGYDPGYITDIIETGQGYRWKRSEIYRTKQPRPFMEEAFGFAQNLEQTLINGINQRMK